MKKGIEIKSFKKSKGSLLFAMIVSLLSVFTTAVSTYAWFQVSAQASINTESETASITVANPDVVHFYRFNGNGTPGSSYYGYSKSDAAFGNTVNVVDTSTNKYQLSGGSWVSYNTNTWNTAWTEIDITNNTQVQNAFDFSKMRPGCYYSFCIDYGVSTAKLKTTFSWSGGSNVIGSSLNRYVWNSGTTSYPLNLLMGINGYATASTGAGSNAASFINGTFSASTAQDKIVFTNTSSATSESYYLLGTAGAGVDTSTNNHIYFTIFMGFADKSDALIYRGNSGANSYYERGVNTGGYGPLDGLKSTLTSIELL